MSKPLRHALIVWCWLQGVWHARGAPCRSGKGAGGKNNYVEFSEKDVTVVNYTTCPLEDDNVQSVTTSVFTRKYGGGTRINIRTKEREAKKGVADCFNKDLSANQMTAVSSDGQPQKLNFAINADLDFNGVKCSLRIGQGSNWRGNNWWIGGSQCNTIKNSDMCCRCGSTTLSVQALSNMLFDMATGLDNPKLDCSWAPPA